MWLMWAGVVLRLVVTRAHTKRPAQPVRGEHGNEWKDRLERESGQRVTPGLKQRPLTPPRRSTARGTPQPLSTPKRKGTRT